MNINGCNLNAPYLGFSHQLFRVRTGVYKDGDINFAESGPFLRIYSRGTALCLSPSFPIVNDIPNPLQPIISANLKLSDCGITKYGGYWWYLLPTLTQPPPYQKDKNGIDIVYIVRQQLIYVTDPSVIPTNITALTNWVFANINNIYSIQNNNFTVVLDKLIYVNKNNKLQTKHNLKQIPLLM